MSLSYFTIFNPSLGPDEDTLSNQLLFYTSSTTSDLDSQLRNIGLVQGILEFGRSFSGAGAEPVNVIKSNDTRTYLLEVEPGYWALLCLSVVTEDGSRMGQTIVTEQALTQMKSAYDQFVFEHDRLNVILEENSREAAAKIIEAWWLRWSWSWNLHSLDATYLFDGVITSRTQLSAASKRMVSDKCNAMFRELGEKKYACTFIFDENELLWQDDHAPKWSTRTKRRLQNYVLNYLSDPKTSGPSTSQDGESRPYPEAVSTTTPPPSEPDAKTSWLTGHKWTTETNRMLNALSFRKPVQDQDVPAIVDLPHDGGSFRLTTPKLIHVNQDESRPLTRCFLNIFHYRELYLVVCLNSEDTQDWSSVEAKLRDGFPELAESITPRPQPDPTPFFFSLYHDSTTGSIYNTIPSLSAALEDCETDTPARQQTKSNTVHLHQQIYALIENKEVIVKTNKNIWILIDRHDESSVVLCKSSKNGETMEEVEKEGKRIASKLRSLYSG